MPRGKNYVNNDKGLALSGYTKKKTNAVVMMECQYGVACTRDDCIYRHPHNRKGTNPTQSREPCMPFLAGQCAFSAKACRKRHPPKLEADQLVAKYKMMQCRFGAKCKTHSCLYIHPQDTKGDSSSSGAIHSALFPPLGGGGASTGIPTTTSLLLNSAWKVSPVLPRPPPQARSTNNNNTVQQTSYQGSATSSANRSAVPSFSHAVPSSSSLSSSSSSRNGGMMMISNNQPALSSTSHNQDDGLNVHASEFVPGKF